MLELIIQRANKVQQGKYTPFNRTERQTDRDRIKLQRSLNFLQQRGNQDDTTWARRTGKRGEREKNVVTNVEAIDSFFVGRGLVSCLQSNHKPNSNSNNNALAT